MDNYEQPQDIIRFAALYIRIVNNVHSNIIITFAHYSIYSIRAALDNISFD